MRTWWQLMMAGLLMTSLHAESEPPLQWRDSYIKRRQLMKPNWQIFDAKDGTKFAIDIDHISRKRHAVVFYLIGGDAFDPKRLTEFMFSDRGDYGGVIEIVSAVDAATVKLIEPQAKQMVCGGPDQ
jgi:hypothetical protein